jgi:hypothetical protein
VGKIGEVREGEARHFPETEAVELGMALHAQHRSGHDFYHDGEVHFAWRNPEGVSEDTAVQRDCSAGTVDSWSVEVAGMAASSGTAI